MIERGTMRRLRAGAIVAFWLAFAALPLIVSLRRVDPLACCRGDGAHRCFMRPRGSKGGLAFRAETKLCATATAKAVPSQTVLLSLSLLFDDCHPFTRLALWSWDIPPFIPRVSRPSRAPPAA
jgi:hypothetical protein